MSISDPAAVAGNPSIETTGTHLRSSAHPHRPSITYASRTDAANTTQHAKATRLLHWGTVLALIIGVGIMFIRELIEEKTYRIGLLEVHRQLGMLVLVAVFLRVSVRCWVGLTKPEPMSKRMRLVAGLCHLALYVLLLALPILGWAITNAHNSDLNLFGLYTLPRLVADDPDWADELTDYHIWVSWALLAMVLLHIGGALFHHYVLKDKILLAMLPGNRPHLDAMPK